VRVRAHPIGRRVRPAGSFTRQQAIGRYWDQYAAEAKRLLFKYPMNVRVYDMGELVGRSSHATQRELLRWLGVRTPRVRSHWHANPWQEATYDDAGEARLWGVGAETAAEGVGGIGLQKVE
jgi:hypothetical protein